MKNIDLMGEDIYTLIYQHRDKNGGVIEDFEDVLFCDDEDIPRDRISKLVALLKPIKNGKDALISLEASKLLAAWGEDKAVDFYKYCLDSRIDKLGNISPHRIYGYDTIYEEISDSLLNYYARLADKSNSDELYAKEKIQPLLKEIINLSKELPFSFVGLLETIKRKKWREYEPELKKCFIEFLQREGENRNLNWNIQDLKKLLLDWDSDFVKKSLAIK